LDLAATKAATPSEKPRLWNDPRARSLFVQVGLVVALVALVWLAADNTLDNMRRHGIPTNFSFWDRPAGFDISQSLISYSAVSTYGRAFWVGLLNTLMVAVLGIVFATMLGFALGGARLSKSWIVARLATTYVETVRNVPLLLQLLFWYNAVLSPLPGPRQSLPIFNLAFLNNRGLFVPEPVPLPGFEAIPIAFAAALVLSLGFWLAAKKRQRETGDQWPVGWVTFGLVIGLPLAAYVLAGAPLDFSVPVLKGFNFQGGLRLTPEFVSLVFALSLYTAAFIAEIVRAGIQAVPHGQSEAAAALGLPAAPTRRLVIMPQAMRVIVPPLTNQYLNLTKNSSLAVFIGFPDLVQVFAGTVLNQTGAAVQVIGITMAVYLTISLVTSWVMNSFNRRMALRER
jgi:general L-amino acid transport system permease protein